jgi:PAS domain S-box-containing protein
VIETKTINTEDSLSNNEHYVRHIFMQAPVAILMLKGKEYEVEMANELMLQILDKGNDLLRKPLFAVMPELIVQVKAAMESVSATGIPYHGKEFEAALIRNGEIENRFFNFVFHPKKEIDGTISGIIVVANDITEQILSRKKIEDSEHRYHEMIHSSESLIAILQGENSTISIANDAILAQWGKGKDVIGKPFFDVLPEFAEQGFDKQLTEVYKTGNPVHATEVPVNLVHNGKPILRYYNYSYQAQRNTAGEIYGISIIGKEVSPQAILNLQLKESEARFRNLVEKAPVPICIMSGENMILEVANEWVLKIWNAGREVIGKPFLEIVPEMKEQPFMGLLLDVYKNGVTHYGTEAPAFFINANGEKETSYFNFVYQPACSADGSITGVMVLATDVTEQVIARNTNLKIFEKHSKELEKKVQQRTSALNLANAELQKKNIEIEKSNQSLVQKNIEIKESREKLLTEYSRSLIEASRDPLVTISTKGKIMDMNEAMIDVTEKTRVKLINTNFENYFTDTEKAKNIYQEVFKKGYVIDYPLTLKDGKLTDVLFNGSVYKDGNGNVLGAVVVARDISEQKKIEKELIEAKVFAELATSIAEEEKIKAEAAAHVAEDAVKSKQQFLSNMSHEIRTPMNAIIGFTKVILKTDLTEKQKEYLNAIKMSGDALIVLINDILDLAKVDAGKMTFEQTPFKMELSVTAMLQLFDTKIKEKNLEIIKEYDTEIPAVLVGDPARLHQIFLNLISNAVKFTANGQITVAVKLLHQNDDTATVEFTITDTGIGIPENKLTKIFDNFQQASRDTSRLYGGTGLGLAIVKNLVEAQGGNIKVKSKINEGTAFSFVLNFRKTKADVLADKEIMELDREIKDIKVLVVEDMALNQLLMKTLLDDFGFERDIVSNGRLAIEKLKTKTYDIILMDLQMPEMNGFEATEYIRKIMQSQIPIIALTADVTTVDLEKCKAAGMDDYIAKPVDERLLYSKIVGLTKKPVVIVSKQMLEEAIEENKIIKCIDLKYLNQRTKSNPVLMMEMIALYLEQTPPLINVMKKSFIDKDWLGLHAAVHKMIPSFTIMGINPSYEVMAKKVQDYATAQLQHDGIDDLITQLEDILARSCNELEEEYAIMKNINNEKGK